MRNFFIKLSPQKLQITCILACISGDFAFAGYLYQIFSDKKAYLENFKLIKKPLKESFQQQGLTLPPNIEHEVFQIIIQTLLAAFALFISFHFIIYTFYWFKKRFAYIYIRFLSFVGIISTVAFMYGSSKHSPLWSVGFIFILLAYIYVIFGTHYFPILPKSSQE